ncbi:hypothetical protein GQ600_9196 [Phytophthora cactorum]|nr:hypothetical protein GQ600_9196 [Phytophthora cactorum]
MAYGFTCPTKPSNPAQRQALSNANSATELLDVLTVAEGQVAVLEANAKHSANHVASLRKVIALSEAKLAKAVEIEKSKIDSALAQARLHHQRVQDRTAEIKTLHQTIADKDAAYVTLQGVAAKHFEQLQEAARLLNSTSDPALRHAQAVVKDPRAVILRQKCIIQRQGYLPLHGPHMAAAAGAGLDVMDIPATESRRVELTILPRQDGSATSPIAAMSSAVAPIASSEAPLSSGPAANSAGGPASSASFLQRPLRTLNQLRRAPLSTLTPKEQLRRYANPTSLTTAGSSRRTSAPPPQPYACPLPGEEGHEEISALLGSNLSQETMSDGEGLRSIKASRRTRRRKPGRLQLSSD